jgi:hypothetical protein
MSWIKLHRKVTKNSIWTNEKFTRGQAWIDLLITAEYNTGILLNTQSYYCKRWKWTRSKVSRFFKYLLDEKMIRIAPEKDIEKAKNCIGEDSLKRLSEVQHQVQHQVQHSYNLYLIENYMTYQGGENESATPSATPSETIKRIYIKEYIKSKKEKVIKKKKYELLTIPKYKHPLTAPQYENLISEFGEELVNDNIVKLDSYKKKKYSNANSTLRNWIKKDFEQIKQETKEVKNPAL